MFTLEETLRIASAVVLLLLAVLLLKGSRRDRHGCYLLFFLGTVMSYLLFPVVWRHEGPPLLVQTLLLGGFVVPFAFWLLTRAYFEDGFRLRLQQAPIVLALLAANYAAWWIAVEGRIAAPGQEAFWKLLPKLIALVLVVHALLTVYVGARADLVEGRLKLRYAVLLVTGSYVLMVVLGEALLSGTDAENVAALMNASVILILVLVLSATVLKLEPEFVRASAPAAAAPGLPAVSQKLHHLLEVEEVFKREGITIGALARLLGEPEYRARKVINSDLGFKNFNTFLHHYRIRAAKKILQEPSQNHLSIAEIAFSLGYASLAPFNKAFKELTGETPTEFRKSRQT